MGTTQHSLQTFDEVALPCLPELARFARSLTRDASDADDLVQETYLRAFEAWRTFQLGTDCRRWLFTICRNVFLRGRERAQRVVSVEDPEADTLGAVYSHMSARDAGLNDLYARIDLGPALDRAIDMLSDPFAAVVRLIDVDGHSYEDVADMLDVPIGTVRSRLFRARRLLQDALLAHALDAGFGRATTASRSGQ
ncbi:MAG: sigma-70 family RNA polymerase sigma factor [Gemmatimonadaceae bacterium]